MQWTSNSSDDQNSLSAIVNFVFHLRETVFKMGTLVCLHVKFLKSMLDIFFFSPKMVIAAVQPILSYCLVEICDNEQ